MKRGGIIGRRWEQCDLRLELSEQVLPRADSTCFDRHERSHLQMGAGVIKFLTGGDAIACIDGGYVVYACLEVGNSYVEAQWLSR